MMDGHNADARDELTPTGEGPAPRLELDGFSGPLDRLLALARDHQVDLARLSLPALVGQLAAALERAVPLSQKADWVVMAAWLLHLRSRLLLPVDAPAQKAAERAAGRLRGRLVELRAVQALAAWLDARPQLGRDVFVRGQPEIMGLSLVAEHEVGVIEFLWAAMALFDDDRPDPDTAPRYRPHWLDLHSIPDARLRIMRLLAERTDGQTLDRLLPERTAGVEGGTETALRRRSAWTSTCVASLELAKQGEVGLQQDQGFAPVRVQPKASVVSPAGEETKPRPKQ